MKRLVLIIILLFNLTGLVGCVNENKTDKIETKKQIQTEKKIVSKDKLNDNSNSDVKVNTQSKTIKENNIQDIKSLIPTGWNILKSTKGDLNKDGIIDKAVVIEKTNKTKLDSPRNLLIFFGNNDGSYTLSIKAEKAILVVNEGGSFGDPFEDMVINRGSILLKFFGGSSKWYKRYRFRYQDNGWYLIGATEGGFEELNGEMVPDEIDYNLITGNYIITTPKDGKLIKMKGNKKKELLNLKDFIANKTTFKSPKENITKSKKKINSKYKIIKDQSFKIKFKGLEGTNFVPAYKEFYNGTNFYLLDNEGYITYTFPEYYGEEFGAVDIKAVSFKDVNKDGLKDVIVIIEYRTGIGQTAHMPISWANVFIREGNRFINNQKLNDSINYDFANDTVENIIKYIEKNRKRIFL